MKFLSWMQSKLQGKVKIQNKASYSFPNSNEQPQEVTSTPSSLPLGLLAIGTFGNNELGVTTDVKNVENQTEKECSSDLEDVSKLEEELREILQQNSQLGEEEIIDDDDNETHEGVKKKIGLVIEEWQGDDHDVEKSNRKSIAKRSVSFLVKKIFVCGSGFAPLPPTPSSNFMDAPQDATMKKILRMMLHKKIYPKNSSQMASLKRFIKEKEMKDKRNEDKDNNNNHDNCNVNSGSKPHDLISLFNNCSKDWKI